MNPHEKMQQMLAELWQQHRDAIQQRVAIITQAAEALSSGSISDEQREEAQSAAHKLAGVLGTFGRSQGTSLARAIENWLANKENLASHLPEIKQALTSLQSEISE